MPRKKSTRKKAAKKKTAKKEEPEIVKENKTTVDENIVENKDISEDIEKTTEDLIPDVELLNKKDLKTRLLELENENAELKATIEKARKKLRIYSKKLDLTEEREEQWKLACYNIANVFAEKSQVSLEDILKQFEAPIEDGISF